MPDEWPVGLPTRLRPLEVVGRGTSSTVWRARDRRRGRDVAVKVLEPGGSRADGLRRARLESEGRALARLRDVDGVVTVHELGLTSDAVGWIVTEFVAAGSLADRGHASMTSAEVAPVAAALAATLAQVHAREVVHGDLSPANLLIDVHGRPRLADFGLAALEPRPDHPGGLTPAFAAPERLAGGAPTPTGDVHALAASLAWMFEPDGSALDDALTEARHLDPARRPAASELAQRLDSSATTGPHGRRRRRDR